MVVPTLLYDPECWASRKRDVRQMESSDMEFPRLVKGCVIEETSYDVQPLDGVKHSLGFTSSRKL